MTQTETLRNNEMNALRANGWTLQEIADKYGISRERVRQIVGNTGSRKDKLPVIQGVYRVYSKRNHRPYIGSSKDVNKRFKAHLSQLRKGSHYNKWLQNDWDTFGEKHFSFDVIEIVEDPTQLADREIHHIRLNENAYNKMHGHDYIPYWFFSFAPRRLRRQPTNPTPAR